VSKTCAWVKITTESIPRGPFSIMLNDLIH
jgi:hypothetical protein